MSWTKTAETGIYRHDETPGKFKVHATAKAPVKGKIVHRRRTLENATLEQAKVRFRELKLQIQTPPDEPDATVPKTSLTHFAVDWVRRKQQTDEWRKGTVESNRQNLRDHILPHIGHLRPEQLSRSHIREWIKWAETATYVEKGEEKRHAHDTLRRWWRVLKGLVKEIYLEGYCERRFLEWCRERTGPQSDVKGRRESRTLRADELVDFVEAARELVPLRAPEIVTIAYTGMRPSELYGLDWDDVDWEVRTIDILRGFAKGEVGPPKAGARRIPMVKPIEKALQQQRERLEEGGSLGLERGIVFPSNLGTRRYPSTLHDPMEKVAAHIGTEIKVGPQVLRKTLNTLLGNAGCRREMIKSIIGHRTDQMHEHYTSVRPEDQHSAMQRLFMGG